MCSAHYTCAPPHTVTSCDIKCNDAETTLNKAFPKRTSTFRKQPSHHEPVLEETASHRAQFAHHKSFYCLVHYSSSPCTELNMHLFACTLRVKRASAQAKLFPALYLTAHSVPQARQSFSNSQCLVKVGIPEMWKSIMDDSSFGLSSRGRQSKGIKG